MVFRTLRKNGKNEIRAYFLPAKRDKKGRVTGYGYERKTPVTNKEKAQRVSFAVISRAVAARVKAGDKRTRKEIWKEVKEEYETRES